MSFENFPVPLPEKKPEEKPQIEISSEIGSKKRTPEEIEKYKKIREEIELEKEIKEKLARGELLSQKEAAYLREIEIIRKARTEGENKRDQEIFEELKEPEKKPEESEKKSEEKPEKILEEPERPKEPEKPETKPRESILDLLTKKREAYVRAKIEKKENLKEFQKEYLDSLKKYRTEFFEKELSEIEKKNLPEKTADKLIREKMEEILKISVITEANNLYDLESKIKLEGKGNVSFVEKAWKAAGRATEWYRKLPLKYKLMISAGLFAGGVAAGAVGGATGAALATGIITGHWLQRVLGGAAAAVGIEGLIKHWQEKKQEKKTLKEFGSKLSEMIKNNDKKLDKKIFDLVGKKKSQKTMRYLLAGSVGVFIASGLLGKAIQWNIQETGIDKFIKETVEKNGISKPSIDYYIDSYETSSKQRISLYHETTKGGPQVAQKGDSVWKIIGKQLEERYGEKFTRLDEARKVYIIDALKDKVVANPEKYGLTEADKIKIGKIYDFLPSSKTEIDKAFEQADLLKEKQIENIKEILTGKKLPEVEVPSYEEPPGEEITSIEGKPEEKPGEYFSEEKLEEKKETILKESKWSFETEEQIKEAMRYNEMVHVEAIGFTKTEYRAIENFKIGKLLELIPSRNEAWEIWRSEESFKLMEIPHDGFYGASEFKKHIRLAELIRSYQPGPWVKEMTVKEFLQRFGPKSV